MYIYVLCAHRGHWIVWKWNYGRLSMSTWRLRIPRRSPGEAGKVNHRANSPSSHTDFQVVKYARVCFWKLRQIFLQSPKSSYPIPFRPFQMSSQGTSFLLLFHREQIRDLQERHRRSRTAGTLFPSNHAQASSFYTSLPDLIASSHVLPSPPGIILLPPQAQSTRANPSQSEASETMGQEKPFFSVSLLPQAFVVASSATTNDYSNQSAQGDLSGQVTIGSMQRQGREHAGQIFFLF